MTDTLETLKKAMDDANEALENSDLFKDLEKAHMAYMAYMSVGGDRPGSWAASGPSYCGIMLTKAQEAMRQSDVYKAHEAARNIYENARKREETND